MLTRAAVVFAVIYGSAFGYLVQNKEWNESNDITQHSLPDAAEESELTKPDLYWKPFNGLPVPEDAILAGVRQIDGENVGVYIGHVRVDGIRDAHLQAVAIYNNSDSVISTYARTVRTKENIQILCAKKDYVDERLKWVPSADQDKYVPDRDFVVVGHELMMVTNKETNLFIGRATFDNTFLVGKVVMGTKTLRFYPYYLGMENLLKYGFEILAYA